MAKILEWFNAYVKPSTDDAYDIGKSDSQFKDLYLDGLAYIDGFGEDTDMGDFDIHSIDGLYGVDDNVYIDMGVDGKVSVVADTGIYIGDGGTTNYAQFAADGELTLAGTARVKQEFALGAESFAPGSTGADSVVLNNYSGWSFDIGDDMIMSFEVPYDCDVSEDLKVEVYWYINEAYGAGAQVKWQIVYACCPADGTEAIDAPTHSDTVTYADKNIPATAKFLTDNSALIPAASVAQDDLISINLERIAADGTDPTADPVVVRVEIEYTKNKLGEPT